MIRRRSDKELEKMHQANAIVLHTLGLLESALEPGEGFIPRHRVHAAPEVGIVFVEVCHGAAHSMKGPK